MGGKGGNQAVAAARLGARVSLVAALGGDELGSEARRALDAEGVDLAGVATVREAATGVAIIVVGSEGENLIVVAGGANDSLSGGDVRKALEAFAPSREDVVLVGHEIPTVAAREALRLGRDAGATTILQSCAGRGPRPVDVRAGRRPDTQSPGAGSAGRGRRTPNRPIRPR